MKPTLTPILATLTLAALLINVTGQSAPPYGESISLEDARKALAAAQTEARGNNWGVVIAIVDTGGHLVALERMDGTQFGSVEVARQKAWSAAAFRRPTRAFQDVLAAGGDGLRILRVEGAVPVEGGLPITREGKIIGAIGVSGVTSEQDGIIAAAGMAAIE